MRVRQPKYNVGDSVCCQERLIRGHRVPRGTIGKIAGYQLGFTGNFGGYYNVEVPGVPGTAIVAEGLLYRPRKRK